MAVATAVVAVAAQAVGARAPRNKNMCSPLAVHWACVPALLECCFRSSRSWLAVEKRRLRRQIVLRLSARRAELHADFAYSLVLRRGGYPVAAWPDDRTGDREGARRARARTTHRAAQQRGPKKCQGPCLVSTTS